VAQSFRRKRPRRISRDGKRADFVLLDAPNYLHLVYHFGVNLVRDVFRDGNQVVRDGR
jgi:imidazolonepropionase